MYAADIVFWGRDKGGRDTPPKPGYHPQLDVGGMHTSCVVTPQDSTIACFSFDIEYAVSLELMLEEVYRGRLGIGDVAKLFEGSRQVAEGKITGSS